MVGVWLLAYIRPNGHRTLSSLIGYRGVAPVAPSRVALILR